MPSLPSSFHRAARHALGGLALLFTTATGSGGASAPTAELANATPDAGQPETVLLAKQAARPTRNDLNALISFYDSLLESVAPQVVYAPREISGTATPSSPVASVSARVGDLLSRDQLSRTEIVQLQQQLKLLNSPDLEPVGVFGPQTTRALERAVADHPELASRLGAGVLAQLEARGKLEDLAKVLNASPAARDGFVAHTLAEVQKARTAEKHVGPSPFRHDVKLLQRVLQRFNPGPADGHYGTLTQGGVDRYQAAVVLARASAPSTPTSAAAAAAAVTPAGSGASPSPAPAPVQAAGVLTGAAPVSGTVPEAVSFPEFAKATWDKATLKAVQTRVGVKPTGTLGGPTLTAVRHFLKDHPEAHGALGKAATQALKEAGELPKVVADLARFLRDNPTQTSVIGRHLMEKKGSPYIFRMAVKAAGGAGSVQEMHDPLRPGQVEKLEASLVAKHAPTGTAKAKTSPAKAAAPLALSKGGANAPAPVDLSRYQPFLKAPALDKAAVKELQALLGIRKPTGVFDVPTGERVRELLKKSPDTYATLGKGVTEALKKAKTLPLLAADWARHLRDNPDSILHAGQTALTSGTPPYLFQLAMKAATGETSVKDIQGAVTPEQVQDTFRAVLFRTKGITSDHPERAPDGTYKPNALGLALLNFNAANGASIKACQAALKDLKLDPGTPRDGAGKKLGTALATALAGDARLVDQLAKSGAPGVAVFGFLLSDRKRAAEAAKTLGGAPAFKALLEKDLIRYAGEVDAALSAKGKTGTVASPDTTSLALRLGLVSREKNFRPVSAGNPFSKAFALAAAAYLRGPSSADLPAVATLKQQAAGAYVSASRLKMAVSAPPPPVVPTVAAGASAAQGGNDLESLKKRYPNDKAGLVDIVVELAPQFGMRPAPILAILDIESSLDPNARPYRRNGSLASSAFGPTQAVEGTWMKWWNRFSDIAGFSDKAQSVGEALALRSDPRVAVTMLLHEIKRSGHKDSLSYYLEHHFGEGGASKLRGNAGAPASAILGEEASGANEYLTALTGAEVMGKHAGALARRGGLGPLYTGDAPTRGRALAKSAPPSSSRLADVVFKLPRARQGFGLAGLTARAVALAYVAPPPSLPPAQAVAKTEGSTFSAGSFLAHPIQTLAAALPPVTFSLSPIGTAEAHAAGLNLVKPLPTFMALGTSLMAPGTALMAPGTALQAAQSPPTPTPTVAFAKTPVSTPPATPSGRSRVALASGVSAGRTAVGVRHAFNPCAVLRRFFGAKSASKPVLTHVCGPA